MSVDNVMHISSTQFTDKGKEHLPFEHDAAERML